MGNKTEYLDYDANAVTYILINSVKEQQRILEEKETKIQALESRYRSGLHVYDLVIDGKSAGTKKMLVE